MIRVWIVALSAVLRAGLEAVLPASRVSVVGSSARVADIPADGIDVVLLDGDRLDEIPPDLRFDLVILSDAPETQTMDLLRSGAKAVLSRDASPAQITLAIEAAANQLLVLPVSSLQTAASMLPTPALELDTETLTAREREVMRLVADGLGNKQIAGVLNISEHTVKFHVTSVMGKLAAGTRAEAVAQAIRRGLIPL